ncbi:hypothetical protein JOQ06_022964, partial [Pogonophryne albipinna]
MFSTVRKGVPAAPRALGELSITSSRELIPRRLVRVQILQRTDPQTPRSGSRSSRELIPRRLVRDASFGVQILQRTDPQTPRSGSRSSRELIPRRLVR